MRCRCLFATHYHGLCSEAELAGVVSVGHMASEVDTAAGLVPLYRLRPGPAPEVGCWGGGRGGFLGVLSGAGA